MLCRSISNHAAADASFAVGLMMIPPKIGRGRRLHKKMPTSEFWTAGVTCGRHGIDPCGIGA